MTFIITRDFYDFYLKYLASISLKHISGTDTILPLSSLKHVMLETQIYVQ